MSLTWQIIGDLAFGEPFGCLQTSSRHPWIETIFKVTQLATWMQSAAHFPRIKHLILKCVPKTYSKVHEDNAEIGRQRVKKRMQLGTTRGDLIEGLLIKQDELQLPLQDIVAHANLLTTAGSETTATLLSGVTFLLTKNPDKLARLTQEVRSTFKSEAEIDINSASQLTYMLACLDEALRSYPPVPIGLPRVVPRGGKTFLGKYVPAGVSWTDPLLPSSSSSSSSSPSSSSCSGKKEHLRQRHLFF